MEKLEKLKMFTETGVIAILRAWSSNPLITLAKPSARAEYG